MTVPTVDPTSPPDPEGRRTSRDRVRSAGRLATNSVDCPTCRATLVSENGAVPWCERCEWNLGVHEPPPDTPWLGRRIGAAQHRVAYRLTEVQFRRLCGTRVDRPGRTVTGTLVTVLAVLFYLLIAALAAFGGWLIIFDFPNLSIIPGVLLVAIAVFLAPRFGRLGEDEERLTREQAPVLHAMVDRIAAAAGTRAPHTIVVSSEFEAAARTVGVRRRRVLLLGLGLWGCMGPQQRVALLAHEMGHFANGDLRRGVLTQPAMTTLGRLSYLFVPSQIVMPFGLVSLLERLTAIFLRFVSSGLWLAHLGVQVIVLREGHREEYHADQRAARIAGTAAAAQMLDLLLLVDGMATVVAARARAGDSESGWREAVADMLARQAPRIGRLRQLSARRDASLTSTHPPSGLRARLVEASGWQEPAIRLTERESEDVDAELAAHYRRARRDIAQSGY